MAWGKKPCTFADRSAVIGEQDHTDWEVFTVLRQDAVGGLQVKNLSGKCKARETGEGVWPTEHVCSTGISAPYIPGTFVIK